MLIQAGRFQTRGGSHANTQYLPDQNRRYDQVVVSPRWNSWTIPTNDGDFLMGPDSRSETYNQERSTSSPWWYTILIQQLTVCLSKQPPGGQNAEFKSKRSPDHGVGDAGLTKYGNWIEKTPGLPISEETHDQLIGSYINDLALRSRSFDTCLASRPSSTKFFRATINLAC